MFKHIYIYIHTHTYIETYIYIYIERERDTHISMYLSLGQRSGNLDSQIPVVLADGGIERLAEYGWKPHRDLLAPRKPITGLILLVCA